MRGTTEAMSDSTPTQTSLSAAIRDQGHTASGANASDGTANNDRIDVLSGTTDNSAKLLLVLPQDHGHPQ